MPIITIFEVDLHYKFVELCVKLHHHNCSGFLEKRVYLLIFYWKFSLETLRDELWNPLQFVDILLFVGGACFRKRNVIGFNFLCFFFICQMWNG